MLSFGGVGINKSLHFTLFLVIRMEFAERRKRFSCDCSRTLAGFGSSRTIPQQKKGKLIFLLQPRPI
jgi:hypothetical protein